LQLLDWITLCALAVNEETAAGDRVVSAPTNGAAGIIPAVLRHHTRFVGPASTRPVYDGLPAGLSGTDSGVIDFPLTAAAIGMEHHLGLTCAPLGGLVQIPCIERSAIKSVEAINAARMALRSDGTHHGCLDPVIKTMRETDADMMTK
jgi:L-serine dehydratase